MRRILGTAIVALTALTALAACEQPEPVETGCTVRWPCRVGAAMCVEGGDCLVCVKTGIDPCPVTVIVERGGLCAHP